jgi:2-polyprenyl-6-methoxyphenol hydroxylase-like FAD-dependent oxidoreductase
MPLTPTWTLSCLSLGCSYELSPDSGHVTAFFKPSSSSSLTASDGSTYSRTGALGAGPVAVKARLLIASDGYFSSVRRQCLNDGPPQVGTA